MMSSGKMVEFTSEKAACNSVACSLMLRNVILAQSQGHISHSGGGGEEQKKDRSGKEIF